VVGASGAGKSSVVRAGLLPALHGGTLPGSAQWTTRVCTPAEGMPDLIAVAGHQFMVIDQFEEVFTNLDGPAQTAYLDQFMEILQARPNVTCVLVLRADYYPHCAARPELATMLADNTVLVGAMGDDDLRAAIEEPARRAGLALEPSLADVLLADVAAQPGALPLLSTALLALWEHREGARLTVRGYLRTGGVREAINRLAEAAYSRLSPAQQTVARRILLRLASIPGPVIELRFGPALAGG